jgi:hypothetical protein
LRLLCGADEHDTQRHRRTEDRTYESQRVAAPACRRRSHRSSHGFCPPSVATRAVYPEFQPGIVAIYACTGASPSPFAICGLPPERRTALGRGRTRRF